MSDRNRYALAYESTVGTAAASHVVRGAVKSVALAALLEAPGVRERDASDALEGLAIGVRETVTVAIPGATLTVSRDHDAPSAEDARIEAEAIDWRAAEYGTAVPPVSERLAAVRSRWDAEDSAVAAADCRYCRRYGRACGRPHGVTATEYGTAAPTVLAVKRAPGIAGQYSIDATVQYPGEDPSTVSFVGSVYGGPIVTVTPTGTQMFVAAAVTDRLGSQLSESWVRRFFGGTDD